MRAVVLPLALLALTGCIGGPDESFPPLQPRPAETPRNLEIRAETPSGISPEERADLSKDIDRTATRLAETTKAAEASGALLDQALKSARGSAVGDTPWLDAQVAWSRFEQDRALLGENRTQVASLMERVATLPPEDADRARAERLGKALDAAERTAAARSTAAAAVLPPPR